MPDLPSAAVRVAVTSENVRTASVCLPSAAVLRSERAQRQEVTSSMAHPAGP